jgi:hypothetical protein
VNAAFLAASDSASHPSWPWVFLPPLLAAALTVLFTWWVQHPRARLDLVVGALTVEDQVQLWRANKRKYNMVGHDLTPLFVRLTNHGNGTAFDVQLVGTHCSPRVFAGYTPTSRGTLEETDPEPEIGFPMWAESLSTLGPGESVTIFVMTSKSPLLGTPELTVTWPRLPQFGKWRKRLHIVLSEAPRMEMGWPGEGSNTRRG